MSQYRYTLGDRLGDLIVSPLGESDFSISWSREDDDGKLAYKKDFGGTITFVKEAYQRLLKLEQTIYRCEFQDITIQKNCGDWTDWFKGRISLNSGTWDLDGCKVVLKFESGSEIQCIEDKKGNEIDMFDFGVPRIEIKRYQGDVQIETKDCSRVYNGDNGLEYYWCDSGDPFDLQWEVYYHRQAYSGGVTEVNTKWARLKMIVPCGETPSPDWTLLQDDCVSNNTQTYVKPVSTYDCVYQNNNDVGGSWDFFYLMECYVTGLSDGTLTNFKNGMRVNDLLVSVINNLCGFEVKSNFFGINVPFEPINYVTGAKSKVLDLLLFQKSDIKRPGSQSVATRAPWTLEGFLNTLVKAFNLLWDVQDGVFIIEHVSFFDRDIGMNLTQSKYDKFVKGKRQYSYKTEEMPSIEKWQWKEFKRNSDFDGLPIVYNDGCVTQESKEIKIDHVMEDVTTDIELITSHPDSESNVVTDDGFALMAAGKEVNGDYYILTEPGILDDARMNNTLGISQLLKDYHIYNRPFKNGIMNGIETEFETVKPTKLGATLSIPFCCGDEFNPRDFVKTFFGLGIVDKATFNFKTSVISLDLLYNAQDGLIENKPPRITNKVVRMFKNETVDIDVTEGWSDPDPNASILSVQIKNSPTNGNANVQNDFKVRYKPNNDFIGNDNFTFTIKDNWGEESNIGLVSIEVLETNSPPVANDDYYTAIMNQTLIVEPNGVFRNDTSTHGFHLKRYDAVSVNGGQVTIWQNGKLQFKPATNFLGVDTFTYTIEDDFENESTATVYITVNDPRKPVAVDDNYLTSKEMSLQGIAGDALIPGLLDNDYTPDGNEPLTATAGTFATNKGGSVQIYLNGSFDYIPPAGFIGDDFFNYTVSTNYGTDTGRANITVIDKVYIRVSDRNMKIDDIREMCNGVNTKVGRTKTKDIALKFFKDSAGTIPFDISGLRFQIFATLQTRQNGGAWTGDEQILIASGGTEWMLDVNFEYYSEYNGCEGNINIINEARYLISNAGHYQII